MGCEYVSDGILVNARAVRISRQKPRPATGRSVVGGMPLQVNAVAPGRILTGREGARVREHAASQARGQSLYMLSSFFLS